MYRAGCSDTPGAKFLLSRHTACHGFILLFLFAFCFKFFAILFHEYEIYGKYKEDYCYKVVPLQAFSLEQHRNYDAEY